MKCCNKSPACYERCKIARPCWSSASSMNNINLKKDNINIGKVTSAVYSPRLKKNIGLAIVSIEQSGLGNKFSVTTNEGEFDCVVVEKPFYDPKKKIASN